MKLIALSRDLSACVDDDMYDALSAFTWFARLTDGRFYAAHNEVGYMHAMVLDVPAGYYHDHIDGNGLNNQRHNLRIATASQNGANAKKRAGTSSQYKGVGWHKYAGKWQAGIVINYVRMHLGLFEREVDAAIAYDNAARALYGEFAKTNF